MVSLAFLGFFGGNFAIFSLWLPEQYPTRVRATAFAFNASVGRFIGAGVNFLLGAAIHGYGSLGVPVAWTAAVFSRHPDPAVRGRNASSDIARMSSTPRSSDNKPHLVINIRSPECRH